jgi:predicted nucleotidyltransferase
MKINQADKFLCEFRARASKETDILGAALVGSYARETASEESDVDLVIFSQSPDRLLADANWIRRFGTVLRMQSEAYEVLTSIRVWYKDGREVEFGITGEKWAALPLNEGTKQVIIGGMRVLFERGKTLSDCLHQLK